eukprot:3720200-Prymnesium_polylepis.2
MKGRGHRTVRSVHTTHTAPHSRTASMYVACALNQCVALSSRRYAPSSRRYAASAVCRSGGGDAEYDGRDDWDARDNGLERGAGEGVAGGRTGVDCEEARSTGEGGSEELREEPGVS